MAEYVYSTVDVDEVLKNNLKISNETLVTNIQNLNKSSEKLLDKNISDINNATKDKNISDINNATN